MKILKFMLAHLMLLSHLFAFVNGQSAECCYFEDAARCGFNATGEWKWSGECLPDSSSVPGFTHRSNYLVLLSQKGQLMAPLIHVTPATEFHFSFNFYTQSFIGKPDELSIIFHNTDDSQVRVKLASVTSSAMNQWRNVTLDCARRPCCGVVGEECNGQLQFLVKKGPDAFLAFDDYEVNASCREYIIQQATESSQDPCKM